MKDLNHSSTLKTKSKKLHLWSTDLLSLGVSRSDGFILQANRCCWGSSPPPRPLLAASIRSLPLGSESQAGVSIPYSISRDKSSAGHSCCPLCMPMLFLCPFPVLPSMTPMWPPVPFPCCPSDPHSCRPLPILPSMTLAPSPPSPYPALY